MVKMSSEVAWKQLKCRQLSNTINNNNTTMQIAMSNLKIVTLGLDLSYLKL